MSLFYKTATACMRTLPAEPAHLATIKALKMGLGPRHTLEDARLQTTVGGLSLPNPVGLAAGFDKNAEVPAAMLKAGFGHVECGTVTPRPQAGNPIADYVTGLTRLWGLSDYFTINISSPNTPGLRELQGADAMDELLGRISEKRAELTGDKPSYPIFLKVAPDLDISQIERLTEQARTYGMNAIIVSNTTIARPESLQSAHKSEAGGLSGQHVLARLKADGFKSIKEAAALSSR